ncbi:MAG: hypothetical protein IJI67_09795 [Clostridia bacterium]|nr:hypothetical protein [Clostridia bacterium]
MQFILIDLAQIGNDKNEGILVVLSYFFIVKMGESGQNEPKLPYRHSPHAESSLVFSVTDRVMNRRYTFIKRCKPIAFRERSRQHIPGVFRAFLKKLVGKSAGETP